MEIEAWNGKRVKALRKSLGLTQSELAQRLKISIDTLRSYEHDARRPSLPIQRRLIRQYEKVKW